MKKRQVYALGCDPYWLNAVAKVTSETIDVQVSQCPENMEDLKCPPYPEAFLLLDPHNPREAAIMVQRLRRQGWRYIIVVGVDDSWRDACNVLRGNNAYDYWKKSYDPEVIRRNIQGCLAEIEESEAQTLHDDT